MRRPALSALLLLAAAAPLARAELIFDNGLPNTLADATAEALVIRDSPGGVPTSLAVVAGGRAPRGEVFGASRLDLAGGGVRSVDAYDDSVVTVRPVRAPFPPDTGFSPNSRLAAHDRSTVIVSPNFEGSTAMLLLVSVLSFDDALVVVNGAEAAFVEARGNSRMELNLINLGSAGRLRAFDDAEVIVGGPILLGPGTIEASGQSRVTLRNNPSSSFITIHVSDGATVTLIGDYNHPAGFVEAFEGFLVSNARITVFPGVPGPPRTTIRFTRSGDGQILVNPASVPEPTALAMAAAGLAALGAWRWRRAAVRC